MVVLGGGAVVVMVKVRCRRHARRSCHASRRHACGRGRHVEPSRQTGGGSEGRRRGGTGGRRDGRRPAQDVINSVRV